MFQIELYTISPTISFPKKLVPAQKKQFVQYLREIDWELETSRALWRKSGAPGMAVIDIADGHRLWFAGHNWLHPVIRGGGSVFRESTEYIAGLEIQRGQGLEQNFLLPDLRSVESLFELFFDGERERLLQKLTEFRSTEVYC